MFSQFADAAAGDRAGEAGLVGGQAGVTDRVPVEILGLLELALLEVASRQGAKRLGQVDRRGRAVPAEGLVGRVDHHHTPHVPQRLHETIRISKRDTAGAADGNRLESLGTHHRAHAAAARGAVLVVHDAGELHQVLAGRSDATGPQTGNPQLLTQTVLGVTNRLAPQMRRVTQLDPVIVNEQVLGRLGLARDQHQVVAGELQLRAPEPARVGGGDAVGQGALGDHHVAGPAGSTGTGQRSSGEDQHVLWRQRIDRRVHLFIKVAVGQPTSADVFGHPLLRNVFGHRGASGHVDSQHLACPTTHHLFSACVDARKGLVSGRVRCLFVSRSSTARPRRISSRPFRPRAAANCR